MIQITDYINGQIIYISNKEDALEYVEKSIKYHNSEFNYKHRGIHLSENANYQILDDNHIVIKRNS